MLKCVWHFLNDPACVGARAEALCVICGAISVSRYTDKRQWLCDDHWPSDNKVRRAWWAAIQWGKAVPPNAEAIKIIEDYFGCQQHQTDNID